MLGRILKSAVFVFLVSGVVVVLTGSRLWGDEPPAADSPKPASSDEENKPLDVASNLILTRERNLELLTQVQSKRISVDLRNTPLDHAIAHLSELSGIPMQLDVIAVEEVGVAIDVDCSVRANNARVPSVLSRILDRLDLGWTIENESLQITTNEVISENLQTMVFASGDIVEWFEQNKRSSGHRDRFGFAESANINGVQTMGFLGNDSADEILVNLIQQHAGGEWEEIDGVGGTVRFEGGLLTVRQALPVLLQVESFLKRLRSMQNRPPSMDVWAIPEGGFGWPENRKVMKALRMHMPVKLKDVPLNDAIAMIAKTLKLQIDIDVAALDEIGLLDNEPVTLSMSGSASAVLKQLLSNLQLTWIILDDSIQVTTFEAAEESLYSVIADTRQLFATGSFTDEGLAETIQFETDGLWEDLDGAGGTIRTAGGLTFIRQTQQTIAEASVLLQDLKSRATLIDSSKPAVPDRESGGMETRFYRAESKEDVQSLMTALMNFVFPDTWETNGGDGVMVEVGSRLVVRQTQEVHKAITEFVRELQAAE